MFEPTDEDIMELMPQQMRDDLAAAARALAADEGGGNIKAAAVYRIIDPAVVAAATAIHEGLITTELNRHAVDHARAVLAKWGHQ